MTPPSASRTHPQFRWGGSQKSCWLALELPAKTLVGETLVTASSRRRNSRNFRKRYANQDGGPR
jgi:hypothetical protein